MYTVSNAIIMNVIDDQENIRSNINKKHNLSSPCSRDIIKKQIVENELSHGITTHTSLQPEKTQTPEVITSVADNFSDNGHSTDGDIIEMDTKLCDVIEPLSLPVIENRDTSSKSQKSLLAKVWDNKKYRNPHIKYSLIMLIVLTIASFYVSLNTPKYHQIQAIAEPNTSSLCDDSITILSPEYHSSPTPNDEDRNTIQYLISHNISLQLTMRSMPVVEEEAIVEDATVSTHDETDVLVLQNTNPSSPEVAIPSGVHTTSHRETLGGKIRNIFKSARTKVGILLKKP